MRRIYDDDPALAWERRDDSSGEAFIIKRLNIAYQDDGPAVYLAGDDPFAGIAIRTLDEMDDMLNRLRQARDWLAENLPSTN